MPLATSPFIPSYMLNDLARQAALSGDLARQASYQEAAESAQLMMDQGVKDFYNRTPRPFHPIRRFSPPIISIDQLLRTSIYDAEHKENFPEGSNPVRTEQTEGDTGVANVDGAFNSAYGTQRFLNDVYGLYSLDDKGMPVRAAVNIGTNYVNAYWWNDKIHFGNGDGVVFGDFAEDHSVVAHEMAHGVVELFGGGLIYRGMSGALNEHFGDVIAIMSAQYMRGEVASPEAYWLIGRDAMIGDEYALRTFKNEKAYENHPGLNSDDPQGKSMDKYYRGRADNYGVHINSGIPNHAFFLAANEIGRESWLTLGPVWMGALQEVGSRATFKEFAEATLLVAGSIFAGDPSIREAIEKAWAAVKVIGDDAIEIEQVFEIAEEDDAELFGFKAADVKKARGVAKEYEKFTSYFSEVTRVGIGEKDGKLVVVVFTEEGNKKDFSNKYRGYDVVMMQEWDTLDFESQKL